MASYEKVSDFFMTGCALAPAIALFAGRPELALFAHILLLFTAIGFAACDHDAPFRTVRSCGRDEA